VYGSFTPLPSFEKIAPLLQQLERAFDDDASSEDEDSDQHLDLLERVNQLGLTVRHPNGVLGGVLDFKINEGQFEYKDCPIPSERATHIKS
jgi:hypothetical protein